MQTLLVANDTTSSIRQPTSTASAVWRQEHSMRSCWCRVSHIMFIIHKCNRLPTIQWLAACVFVRRRVVLSKRLSCLQWEWWDLLTYTTIFVYPNEYTQTANMRIPFGNVPSLTRRVAITPHSIQFACIYSYLFEVLISGRSEKRVLASQRTQCCDGLFQSFCCHYNLLCWFSFGVK